MIFARGGRRKARPPPGGLARRTRVHPPQPRECPAVPVVGLRPRDKPLAREVRAFRAVAQSLLIDTALEDPAIGRPVRRAVAVTSLAEEPLRCGFRDPLALAQPAHLAIPRDGFGGRLLVERVAADRARLTVEAARGPSWPAGSSPHPAFAHMSRLPSPNVEEVGHDRSILNRGARSHHLRARTRLLHPLNLEACSDQ